MLGTDTADLEARRYRSCINIAIDTTAIRIDANCLWIGNIVLFDCLLSGYADKDWRWTLPRRHYIRFTHL